MKQYAGYVVQLLFLTMALVLGGCGGGGDSGDAATPPVSAPVASNRAPSISGTPGSSVMIGESFSFTPASSDPDGDNLTFDIQNKPGWANFNTSNGSLSGTPGQGDIGTYSGVSITVSDGEFSASLSAFSVSVNQIGMGSVTLSWTAPTQNEDGTILADLAAYKFYYGSASGNYPNQVQVDNPGVTSYVIDNLLPNTYYFVATAINSSGVESSFSNEVIKVVL